MIGRWIGKAVTAAAAVLLALVIVTVGDAEGVRGNRVGAAADPHPYNGSDRIIASSSAQGKSTTLDIIGSQGSANSGFNFNGFANGDMIIKVPSGWRIHIDYRVDSSLSHSAIIVPWNERQAAAFTRAFPGSAIPHYLSGINKSDPPAHFAFTADKPGRYALVCAIPGHDIIGMWDQFDVVGGLAKPEVLVK